MIPSNVRVFVCPEPQDMRRGFDRLARTVQAEMGGDPRNGAFFVAVRRTASRPGWGASATSRLDARRG
ncbi:MAG: IS66 family insertion sequence element accessory protein TnpB [Fimbriimonadaceae bacterium]|nr:IS66 family insertion sequence element accessory protein TnpB [Fimbriimonadaceae bacterium]